MGAPRLQSAAVVMNLHEGVAGVYSPGLLSSWRRHGHARGCAPSHGRCHSTAIACAPALQIAEMRTGEGKTLVAVLPAFLNALSGAPCSCDAVLFCADALSGRQLTRHALLAGYASCHAFWPSAAVRTPWDPPADAALPGLFCVDLHQTPVNLPACSPVTACCRPGRARGDGERLPGSA